MINDAENPNQILPGLRKAAIALVSVKDEAAAKVFRFLSEEEAQQLVREISKLDRVTAEQSEKVLREFHELELAHQHLTEGGLEYAKRILNVAYGPDRARVLIDKLVKSLGADIATFETLQRADPQQVAKFIQGEHPQTIAIVLAHMDSTAAAAMLMALPSELRADVGMRMATLEQISPEIVNRIAAFLEDRISSLGQLTRETLGGVTAVAEMFNRLEANAGQDLLEQIEMRDPELGDQIRKLMFVFEDLLLIDNFGMREILSRVDKRVLAVALKGTSDKLRKHFFDNMSERAGNMLREDMDALGPVKIREVEGAQQQVISAVRDLESDGVLNLKDAVGEQYVV
jgi:flagellar motor switch protein FliG